MFIDRVMHRGLKVSLYLQGEEVYNTYGRLSNYTLLLMYGFAVPSAENQYNTVDITWPLIKQACEETKWPDMESRCKLIQKMVSFELVV